MMADDKVEVKPTKRTTTVRPLQRSKLLHALPLAWLGARSLYLSKEPGKYGLPGHHDLAAGACGASSDTA